MPVELLLPGRRIPAPKMPSRIALAMAFGVGAGPVLGDKSRYRSHGAITGATWAAGLHGYCLSFNPAIPSYVTVPAAYTHLDFTSEDFSCVARIYIDDLTFHRVILCRGRENVDGYYWQVPNTGLLDFYTSQAGASQRSHSSAGDILVNNWYTVGFSRDGASVRLYRNGVDVTLVAGDHLDPLTSARNAYIGIYDTLVHSPWDGRIEFLRVFRGIGLQASDHLAWHNALA